MADRFNYTEDDKHRIFDDAKSVILDCINEFKVEEAKKSHDGCIKKLVSLVDAVACFRAIDIIFFNGENKNSVSKCESIVEKCMSKTVLIIESK